VHLVAVEREGRVVLRALRLTGPDDGLTPEEDGRLRRAERYLAAANPRAAVEQLDALLARRKFATAQRVDLCRRLAGACIADRDPAGARRAFLEILTLLPADADAVAGLARLDERPPAPGVVSGRAGAAPPLAPAGAPNSAPPVPPRSNERAQSPTPETAGDASEKRPDTDVTEPPPDPANKPIPAPTPPPLSDPR
jgi:hypothetical protein